MTVPTCSSSTSRNTAPWRATQPVDRLRCHPRHRLRDPPRPSPFAGPQLQGQLVGRAQVWPAASAWLRRLRRSVESRRHGNTRRRRIVLTRGPTPSIVRRDEPVSSYMLTRPRSRKRDHDADPPRLCVTRRRLRHPRPNGLAARRWSTPAPRCRVESHGIREFLANREAALMGRTTFEPAPDQRPVGLWPDLDVFVPRLGPAGRHAGPRGRRQRPPPGLLERMRARQPGRRCAPDRRPRARSRPTAPSVRSAGWSWSCWPFLRRWWDRA